ncbi:MAG TPA: glycosyltransferase, partial [Chitinophagaceae bacterium]|nr:glycosyltransferase [Chitinophagaceae bacterium]
MILLLLTCILFIGYSLLLFRFRQSWEQLALFQPGHPASTRISVIIPARNEEHNIGPLLLALQQQSYPAAFTEIIVVDDHSTDRTAEIVQSFPAVILIR